MSYHKRHLESILNDVTRRLFVTHLDLDLYLRVAPELYLEELVVGEIGRVFRNGGIDLTHNFGFTICEFYVAYAGQTDLMDIIEAMLEGLVKYLAGGSALITFRLGGTDVVRQLAHDFKRPWKRYDMIGTLEEKLGVTFPAGETLHTAETNVRLRALCVKARLPYAINIFALTERVHSTM